MNASTSPSSINYCSERAPFCVTKYRGLRPAIRGGLVDSLAEVVCHSPLPLTKIRCTLLPSFVHSSHISWHSCGRNGWMGENEWMDEFMSRWVGEWMHWLMDAWMHGCVNEWMHAWMNGRIHGETTGLTAWIGNAAHEFIYIRQPLPTVP